MRYIFTFAARTAVSLLLVQAFFGNWPFVTNPEVVPVTYAGTTSYPTPSCTANDVSLNTIQNMKVTDICESSSDSATVLIDYIFDASTTRYDILGGVASAGNVIFDGCLSALSATSGVFTDEDTEGECGDISPGSYTISEAEYILSCDPDGDGLINATLITAFLFGWTAKAGGGGYTSTIESPKCSSSPASIPVSTTIDITSTTNGGTGTATFSATQTHGGPISITTETSGTSTENSSNLTVSSFNSATQAYTDDVVISITTSGSLTVDAMSCSVGGTFDSGTNTYTIPAGSILLGDAITCDFEGTVPPESDEEAPVVTLVGSGNMTITQYDTFSDSGATWTDNVDGSGTIASATSGSVDTNSTGTYTLTYTYTDAAGNSGSTSRTVTVTALVCDPGRELEGESCVTCDPGSYNPDAGGSCTLCPAGTFSDSAGSSSCTSCPDGYTSTTGSTSCTDNTPPVVTLSGSASMTISQYTTFSDPGATWTDNADGSGTIASATSGSVATGTTGTYTLTYTYTDSGGNSASATRTVTVTALVCNAGQELDGSSCVSCSAGSYNPDAGGSCELCPAGTFSDSVGAASCTSCPEGYTSSTGSTSCTDNTPPVITLSGSSTPTVTQYDTFTDQGATWTDNADGSGTIASATSGSVDTNSTGTYTLTYTYTDSGGNSASATRTVTVTALVCNAGQELDGSSCVSCSAGSYNPDAGGSCELCPAGTFTDSVGANSCTSCPEGYTSTTGSTSCTEIDSGPTCGDAVIEGSEQCDDGNTISGDGCTSSCQIETGYGCTVSGNDTACGSTGSGSVQVCLEPNDCDGDGVPNSEEQGSPLGKDVNQDGKDDSTQPNIVTKINSIVSGYTTTVIDGCADNKNTVQFYYEPDLLSEDPDYDYDIGLHGFDIDCTSPGITVDVTYYRDKVYDTSNWIYRKFHEATNSYIDFNDQVTYATETLNGTTVTTVSFSVTDGGPYDADGTVNGKILDPVGPAVVPASNSTHGGGTINGGLPTKDIIVENTPPQLVEAPSGTTDTITITPTVATTLQENLKTSSTVDLKASTDSTNRFIVPNELPKTGASIE